jgi:hypothetical protein
MNITDGQYRIWTLLHCRRTLNTYEVRPIGGRSIGVCIIWGCSFQNYLIKTSLCSVYLLRFVINIIEIKKTLIYKIFLALATINIQLFNSKLSVFPGDVRLLPLVLQSLK